MWNQLLPALAPLAQDAPARAAAQGPDFARYAVVCGVLIAAILGLAWGFKRLVGGNLRARASKRSLQVLDVLPLGGKQRLAVVRCYDRTFALGLGDKEVSAIAELDPVIGEDARADARDSAPAADDDRTFQRALSHVQQALAKTREGVGPRTGAQPRADRRAAVAELLGGVHAAQTNEAPAPRPAAGVRKKRVKRRKVAAQPAARNTRDAAPEPRAERASTADAKPARPAPRPAPEARPSLGLEGVMG